RPGLSPPSTRTEWMLSGLPKPASWAALTALAPFTGVTKMTPWPGWSVRAPRAHHLDMGPAPGQRLELVGRAADAVLDRGRPHFRLRRLECHGFLQEKSRGRHYASRM